MVSLSIILPCFNPTADWQKNILDEFYGLKKTLPQHEIELLIMNDGSRFDAEQLQLFLAEKNVFFFDRAENKGKGFTLREGVKKAKGAKIIFTDIDFPYERAAFLNILNALEKNDVAIGVRAENYYEKLPKIRVFVSKVLRFFIRLFLRIPTDDTQCGLKGFTEKGKRAFLETTIDRYLFDLEFVYLAAKMKLSIAQIPVSLRPNITLSKVNFGVLSSEAKNFFFIFARQFLPLLALLLQSGRG